MKITVIFFNLLLGLSSVAGPSISGGTSEQPGRREYQILESVLTKLGTDVRFVEKIQVESADEISVVLSCNGGTKATLIYTVSETCTATRVPGLCVPSRHVVLDEEKSVSCSKQ